MNKAEINIDMINQKAKEIRNALADIEEYASCTLEEFLRDKKISDSTKYKLLVAIEGTIAICNHLVSRYSKKVPESYAHCFILLYESGVISKELAPKLAQMAKFRNLLIHLYWQVEEERVYKIAKENIGNIEEFLRETGRFIKE